MNPSTAKPQLGRDTDDRPATLAEFHQAAEELRQLMARFDREQTQPAPPALRQPDAS